jgi:hypothetical protein
VPAATLASLTLVGGLTTTADDPPERGRRPSAPSSASLSRPAEKATPVPPPSVSPAPKATGAPPPVFVPPPSASARKAAKPG